MKDNPIGPDKVTVVPACVGNGNTHQDAPCVVHGYALVDPGEDDPPVLETAYREVAEYVARLWNEDHA
jgi:hypothetical protein